MHIEIDDKNIIIHKIYTTFRMNEGKQQICECACVCKTKKRSEKEKSEPMSDECDTRGEKE